MLHVQERITYSMKMHLARSNSEYVEKGLFSAGIKGAKDIMVDKWITLLCPVSPAPLVNFNFVTR